MEAGRSGSQRESNRLDADPWRVWPVPRGLDCGARSGDRQEMVVLLNRKTFEAALPSIPMAHHPRVRLREQAEGWSSKFRTL